MILNVATLLAIFEAVVLDKPLIERVLTVAGDPVAQPRNLKVRLGTRLGDLFEECGGLLVGAGEDRDGRADARCQQSARLTSP